jgi:hypothetical protein
MTSTLDQPTTDQPMTSPASVPVDLPGRAVDVVHAAARAAGVRITCLDLSFRSAPGDGLREIVVHLDRRDVGSAQRLLAVLGAVAKVSDPYGSTGLRQVNVDAAIPALGGLLVGVIATEGLPPQPGDPTELIADVDARRATGDPATTATGPAGREPAPTAATPTVATPTVAAPTVAAPTGRASSGKASGGEVGSVERAVRFRARFDSTCPACDQPLLEGEPASWLDGEVVHDTCAEAAGIDVFDPH